MQNRRLMIASGGRQHRKVLYFLLFLPILLSCSIATGQPSPTPAPVTGPTSTPLPTVPPPVSAVGTTENPLILALPPSTQNSSEVQNAGTQLVGLLEKSTGYHFVTVLPPSETDLVRGFGAGGAHIGMLTPFAYLLASGQGNVQAVFAREVNKEIFYPAQFLAHADSGFKPYYDPVQQGDIAEAPVALGQFQGKKPCWSDELSASGYVVPLGYLKQSMVTPIDPAFMGGHVAVVRALEAGGICDFGATYVDARQYPGLQDQYPDLMKKVSVIWQIPAIIPYETLVYASGMPPDMQRNLTRAFTDLMATPEGKSAMQTLYGVDAMQIVQDSQYQPFRQAVTASGVDLSTLIK